MLFLTNTDQMQRATPRSGDGVRGASNVSFVLYFVLDIYNCVGYFSRLILYIVFMFQVV